MERAVLSKKKIKLVGNWFYCSTSENIVLLEANKTSRIVSSIYVSNILKFNMWHKDCIYIVTINPISFVLLQTASTARSPERFSGRDNNTFLRPLHIHSRHYHWRHELQSKVADGRIEVTAESDSMRRVTGGCDARWYARIIFREIRWRGSGDRKERRDRRRGDKTRGIDEPPTMPIIVSRSLEGESTIVFSDTRKRAVIVIGTRRRRYIGYLILFSVIETLCICLYQKSAWLSVIII